MAAVVTYKVVFKGGKVFVTKCINSVTTRITPTVEINPNGRKKVQAVKMLLGYLSARNEAEAIPVVEAVYEKLKAEEGDIEP